MKRSTSSHNGLALLGINLDPKLHVASTPPAFGDTLPECLNGAGISGWPSLRGPFARACAPCARSSERRTKAKRAVRRSEEERAMKKTWSLVGIDLCYLGHFFHEEKK